MWRKDVSREERKCWREIELAELDKQHVALATI